MKTLRITAAVDPDLAPEFFDRLANAPEIEEARVLDWNTTPEAAETVLFAIDGDPEPFAAAAPDAPSIESLRLSDTRRGRTYALAVMRPLVTSMFAAIRRARTRSGLLVRKPIVYRDGDMRFRVVGEPGPIQRAIDRAPEAMDLRIDWIGPLREGVDDPAGRLSDRQYEAVATALELGYYDRPRGATQADVGAELGCAPQTAGEHLRKAEAKLVGAAFDGVGTRG